MADPAKSTQSLQPDGSDYRNISLPPSSADNLNKAPVAGENNAPLLNTLHGYLDQILENLRTKIATEFGMQPATPSSSHEALPERARKPQGPEDLAALIDHTLLKADATADDIRRVCEEARKHRFATVCVNSSQIPLVAELLKGSTTLPIAVVGFPLGAASPASKAFEAREAIRNGAREIDTVINLGALKSRDYAAVFHDLHAVVAASHPYPVKVILETASLNEEQKIIGCALSKAAGAAFVKTSTGFGAGGATAEDIALMRKIVGPELGVKASGGIRTREDTLKMIAAGANRVGASASVAIVQAEPPTGSNNNSGY